MGERELDPDSLISLVDSDEVESVRPVLADLREEADLLLFIGPGCPVCPRQIRSVATVRLASEHVHLRIVDATAEPGLAADYHVGSVPTTVVDQELVLVGVTPPAELARRLAERHGPHRERVVLEALVDAGRHREAARRLTRGRGAREFVELWAASTMGDRMGLLLVVEEALEIDPEGLDALVPHLLDRLEGEDPLGSDAARRGDTADLLGRIGHPDGRAALKRLARDPNAEVAEAAKLALEELLE